MKTLKTLRTCKKGHNYYKSSDCPICPMCEELNKTKEGFLSLLGAPAGRALMNANINTVEQLSHYTQKEIMNLHGMGPGSLPALNALLASKGLVFKSQTEHEDSFIGIV